MTNHGLLSQEHVSNLLSLLVRILSNCGKKASPKGKGGVGEGMVAIKRGLGCRDMVTI